MPEPITSAFSESAMTKQPITFYKEENPPLVLTLKSIDKAKRDLVYRIKAKSELTQYRKKNYDTVERTYAEFERLHSYLVNAYPECIVPILPRQPDDTGNLDRSLRLIKNSLQIFLTRLASHPILRQDSELQSFIESDFVYTPTSRANPIKVSRFRTKPKDAGNISEDRKDPLDQEYSALVALESNLQNASKILTRITKANKNLTGSEAEVAVKLSSFAASEVNSPMSKPLRKLGECFLKCGELNGVQLDHRNALLGYLFDSYVRNAKYIQLLLLNRINVKAEYENSVKTSEKRRQAIVVMKASSNIKSEKVNQAVEDLEEAKQFETYKRALHNKIDRNLRSEIEIYEETKVYDFLSCFNTYARKQLELERQKVQLWERMLNELI
ncbi:Phox-like protein [Basidiobolus meristosporus CBS 931.73]|uniref:Phox-like protein n=1 Tax=Basidiobolus meristosporus CBS 931.73 TaxID=1314790 RepID=A0A1Y1YAW4_9FUNG|nr:Phox-like protein [Basidiobolus meristosporus CBS 931.73]|eukprot:ORX94906.1 Phox-like protein [Basidiobolus meristosporus CBS 931.73]